MRSSDLLPGTIVFTFSALPQLHNQAADLNAVLCRNSCLNKLVVFRIAIF